MTRAMTKNGQPSDPETWPRKVKLSLIQYCETIRRDSELVAVDYESAVETRHFALTFTFENGESERLEWKL